jgi:hypothetical protein
MYFIPLLFAGCVSSILKAPAPRFSDSIILPELNFEFERVSDSHFPAWKHKTTGAILSIFSECDNPEVNLNEAHRLISNSVESAKLDSESISTIGDKKVFLKNFSAEIEAEPIEIWIASFRNENCVYVSSISGHPKKPELIKSQWYQFIENVKFKK